MSPSQTGSYLDIVPQVAEVDLKYNPYNISDFNYDFTKNASGGSFGHITSPSPNDFYRATNVGFPNWASGTTSGSHFRGVQETVDDSPIYYLYIDASADEITYSPTFSNINPDGLLNLRINFESYLQTRVNDGNYNNTVGDNIFSDNPKTQFYAYYIAMRVQVGNQYWNGSSWSNSPSGFVAAVRDWTISDATYVANNSASQVGDKWMPIKPLLIPLIGMVGGDVKIKIENILTDGMITPNWPPSGDPNKFLSKICRKLLLRNFQVDFCTNSGAAIDNSGVLITGNVTSNTLYKTNQTNISTTCGSGPFGVSRGTYLEPDNHSIINYGLYRDSDGVGYPTEQRVIQSFVSQYKQPRTLLMGDLDVTNYLISANMKLIKDSTYQGAKAFYIVSGNYNDKLEYLSAQMIEITQTRDSI